MIVAIAGAHGKIAMRLARLLVADGDRVIGLIRRPEHEDDLRQLGATPVVCDLEQATIPEIAGVIAGADAAVFAAGAGPGSGAERKLTIDRDGAIKLLRACVDIGVDRFLIVSSIGAENPPHGEDTFSVYLRAKAEADRAVIESDRKWTILRPGRLTDGPGRGRVRIDQEPFRGEVPRDDVAAVLGRLVHDVRSDHRVLYVNGGEDPIEQALEKLLSA
jgi:nucleoside-diphosphate-sugar epimerase